MKFVLSLFVISLFWSFTNAQLPPRGNLTIKLPSNLFFNEFTGKPYLPTDQSDIPGSPFINKEWKRCIIKINDGRYFEDVLIKLNILNQTVHYRSWAGAEMEVSNGIITEVQMIDTTGNGEITTRLFWNGFKPIGNNDENTFYEALDTGKADLLLCRKVKITEVKVVGLATQKEYQSSQEYYISIGNDLVKCKKSSSFFVELFADKKDLVKKYIDENNLKFKSEKDLVRIVRFYNSL